jgi:hypothetical protein
MASTKKPIMNDDLYRQILNTKLREYNRTLNAYVKSKNNINKLKNRSSTIVFVPKKTIQGTPSMTTNQPTKELCKSTITGQYKAARYDKNKNCGLFTTNSPRIVDSNASTNFVIVDELYYEKNNFDNLNKQLIVKCDDLLKTLKDPYYYKIYGDIMQNNKMFLKELNNMSKQLNADRNEINQRTGLTFTQEMDLVDETKKMSKLRVDSNYYIGSLLVFVLIILVIGGVYLMVPSSTNGVVQTGGGKLSKQSYFMIATLLLASIIIYQLRIYRN